MSSNSPETDSPYPTHSPVTPRASPEPPDPNRLSKLNTNFGTPVANRLSGNRTYIDREVRSEENKLQLAEEIQGYCIGPMPVHEFLERFTPVNKSERLENPFSSLKYATRATEKAIYAKFVPAAQSLTTSLVVSDSSAMRNDIAPDVSFYQTRRRVGTRIFSPQSVDFPEMDLFGEIKRKRWHDPWTDDRNHVGAYDMGSYNSDIEDTQDTSDPPEDEVYVQDKSEDIDDRQHLEIDPEIPPHPYPFEKRTAGGKAIRGQVAAYMAAMTGSQYRAFGFCFVLFRDVARLIRWDASGIIISQAFNYIKTDFLAEFLWRFGAMTDVERGRDPSVVPITNAEAKKLAPQAMLDDLANCTRPHPDDNGLSSSATRATHRYFCTMQLPSRNDSGQSRSLIISFPPKRLPRSIIGRIPRPCYAYDPGQKAIVFVKQYWRACTPGNELEKEADIYQHLKDHDVRYLPVFNDGNDVTSCETKSHELYYPSPSWANRTKEMIPLRLYRLSLVTLGRPLPEAKSLLEIVKALIQIMICHDDAVFKAGILHRDIHPGNMMIDMSQQEASAFLIDWELATRLKDTHPAPRRPDRTATWQFVSYHLAKNRDSSHAVVDDRESALWVLVWTLMATLPHSRIAGPTNNWTFLFDKGEEGVFKKPEFLEAHTWVATELDIQLRLPTVFSFLGFLAQAFSTRYAIQQPGALNPALQHAIQNDPVYTAYALVQKEVKRKKEEAFLLASTILYEEGGLVKILGHIANAVVSDDPDGKAVTRLRALFHDQDQPPSQIPVKRPQDVEFRNRVIPLPSLKRRRQDPEPKAKKGSRKANRTDIEEATRALSLAAPDHVGGGSAPRPLRRSTRIKGIDAPKAPTRVLPSRKAKNAKRNT